MEAHKTLAKVFVILVLSSFVVGTSFAQFRPQPIPIGDDEFDPNDVVLYGTNLDETDLYDGTDVDETPGIPDLLDGDGNIRYNVHIVPWIDGAGQHETDITINPGIDIGMQTGRSIIIANSVSFTVNGGPEENIVQFGHFNDIDPDNYNNGTINDFWHGALIIDDHYNQAWDITGEEGTFVDQEEDNGINLNINWAEFILGGPVDDDNVANWNNEWGVDDHVADADIGAAFFIRSERTDGNELLVHNTKILGSFREEGNNFRVGRSERWVKGMEIHGDGDPELDADDFENGWTDMYHEEDDSPVFENPNFENVDVIGWHSHWDSDNPILSCVVEIRGENFRFSNMKVCYDPVYYLFGWGGEGPFYADQWHTPHLLWITEDAQYNMFDNCFFASSHLELICIEGQGTVLDNCEVTMFHQKGQYSHSHLIDVKPLDAQGGEVWNAIRNCIICLAEDEGIHHSNGELWVMNNLIHSNGSYWPRIIRGKWDKNAGLAVHPGYATERQQDNFVDIHCEPHVINNTFVANAVGMAIFPDDLELTSEFKNNIIYDGRHWDASDREYCDNKCAIWYDGDPTNLNNPLKPQHTTIWQVDGDDDYVADYEVVYYRDGHNPEHQVEEEDIRVWEPEGDEGWIQLGVLDNIHHDPEFDDDYFIDRERPPLTNGANRVPNPQYVALHRGRDGGEVNAVDFHICVNSPCINEGDNEVDGIGIDPDESDNNHGLTGGCLVNHFNQDHLDEMVAFFDEFMDEINIDASSNFDFYCRIPTDVEVDQENIQRDTYLVEGDFAIAEEAEVTIEDGVIFLDDPQFDIDLGLGSHLIIENPMDNIVNLTGTGSLSINIPNDPDGVVGIGGNITLTQNANSLTISSGILSVSGNIALSNGCDLVIDSHTAELKLGNASNLTMNGGSFVISPGGEWYDHVHIKAIDDNHWGQILLENCNADISKARISEGGNGVPMLVIGNGSTLLMDRSQVFDATNTAIQIGDGANNIEDVTINRCSIYESQLGIDITDEIGDAIIRLYNNFICEINGEPGIGIRSQDNFAESNETIRIHNNIIFETEGDCIHLSNTSRADLIYNTLYSSAENCISVDGSGSNGERIFNNVFASWGPHNGGGNHYAVIYENGGGANGKVDFNVYCDPQFQRMDAGNQWSEGEYTLNVNHNNPPSNWGPQQVAWIRTHGNPDYNPWIEDDQEHDDVSCMIWSDFYINPGYDFHLYEGVEGESGLPCHTDRAFYDANSWWQGSENNHNLPRGEIIYVGNPPIPRERGEHRRIRVEDDLAVMHVDFIHGPPDAGAYGGPWADFWRYNPANSIGQLRGGWDGDAIYVNFVHWRWEGNPPGYEHVKLVGDFDDDGDLPHIAGAFAEVEPGVGVILNSAMELENVYFACLEEDNSWDGFKATSMVSADDISISNCQFLWADNGFKAIGVQSTSGRAQIDNCFYDSCGVGIYANNSRLALINTKILNSYTATMYGVGVYMVNCTAGQIYIDGCDISDNGVDGTFNSGAVYLLNSDAEIVNTQIYENSGTGITCYGSSPDLNTYDYVGGSSRHNDIRDNGPKSPTDPDGAEIYLCNMSSPIIKYNNIYDFDTSPDGKAIYMSDDNLVTLYASMNYWGTPCPDTYESGLFRWGTGAYIIYSPWENSPIVDNIDEFSRGMRLWDIGEYEAAASIFMRTVNDTGSVGINSVHYLVGCISEVENGDFRQLRGFLQDIAVDHRDERITRLASRWATHCLTEIREYEDAMEEYDEARRNAECLRDSVLAAIDYLSVLELVEGNRVNAIGDDIHKQIRDLMELLNNAEDANRSIIPCEFALGNAYPNPFNSNVKITYSLPEQANVRLVIYDVRGREIRVLYEGSASAGVHSVSLNASGLPSGLYICKLNAVGHQSATIKLSLIR